MHKLLKRMLPLLIFALLMSACENDTGISGPQAGMTESWRVVKLLTQGEQIESITDIRTVRRCGPIIENKSVSCIAGTNNELSFSNATEVGISLGVELGVEAEVGNALGLNRESGEELDLITPETDGIYQYIITTEYRVVAGEALAQSTQGRETNMTYSFQATCSLQIEAVEVMSCETAEVETPGSEEEPESTPAANITPTPTNDVRAEALIEEGSILTTQDRYDEAIIALTEALRLDPESSVAFNQRGNAYRLSEEYERALADFTNAINYGQTSVEAATYYTNRGVTYREMGSAELAEADFTLALQLNPTFSRAYENRAKTYFEVGKLQQAIDDYSAYLNLTPDNANIYQQRGQIYQMLGQYQNAANDFTQFLASKPDNASGYISRGSAYRSLGDVNAAITDFSKAIELDPNSGLAYFNRGSIYADLGNAEQALSDLQRATLLGYGNEAVYVYRASANFTLGNYAPAVDDYTNAIEQNTTDFNLYFGRGLSHFNLADYPAAITDLSTALQFAPNQTVILFYRGQAYQQNNQIELAQQDYQSYLRLSPDGPFAAQVQDLIRKLDTNSESLQPISPSEDS